MRSATTCRYPTLLVLERRDLCRAIANVSVLEEGGLHSRQGDLSARREKEGGILGILP